MKRTRLGSLNDAIEGIIHTVRSQANIRIHLFIAAAVLILTALVDVSRVEFILLTLVIGLVLVTELLNTALEASVDLIADHYHPLAKIVKDVSAGAVLVSSVVAVICGYLIFYHKVAQPLEGGIFLVKRWPPYITLVALVLVIIMVVAAKARFGKGTPLSGGMPSGHAAVSFAVFTAVALSTGNALVILLTFVLAVMVSHSRLVYRIHNLKEVVAGAVLGTLVTLLLFQFFG